MNYVSKQLLFFVFLFSVLVNGQELNSKSSLGTSESYYVPAVNGTKLAVDVYYPKGDKLTKRPVLFEFTRYWRAKEDPKTGKPLPSLRDRDSLFFKNDYILVKVDARGTGASYGVRPGEYTPIEVMDAKYIVDWVVQQPWSDGTVGAYGTSYSGTTAELLCATGHEAVKAVIPGWSDFDIYESPGRPYGMVATSFVSEWSKVVDWLDNNRYDILQFGIRRVGDSMNLDAIAEHKGNPNVFEKAKKGKYKDASFGEYTHEECSPIHWHKEISESGVPMLVLAGWMDAGTADGALLRFQNFTNLQKVVLMPTSHGGKAHSSPYVVSNKVVPPLPSQEEQLQLQLDFFDQYLKGEDKGVTQWPAIKYYNFGEEAFKTTEVWPPSGQTRKKFYFGENGVLNTSVSETPDGMDTYEVDYTTSTGTNNRWATQMGKPILNLDNRNAMDAKMLTYTTRPLQEDVQITGTPSITIQLSTTLPEGAVFVYLEEVDPDGKSRYITEGGLLLEHRKLSKNPWSDTVPYHSFKKVDATPMLVNEVQEITFKLWPTSVLIKKGHSLRIAIAGADIDTFDRVPAEGTPVYTVYRNKEHTSFLELPILQE